MMLFPRTVLTALMMLMALLVLIVLSLPALTLPAFAATSATGATNAAPAKYPVQPPPSATLHYQIKASQSGLHLEGKAQVQWRAENKRFSVRNEARATLLGKILDSRSEGQIDKFGLAPLRFDEKRIRRDATTTTFDRDKGVIRFSTSQETHPIHGGEQDRDSVLWQLVSVARAQPRKFTPGSEWRFVVAGARDADPWIFKVVARETIRTPMGDMNTLHLVKQAPEGSKKQTVDIWLAPQREWYPVRMRHTEKDGDTIDQTVEEIQRPPAT